MSLARVSAKLATVPILILVAASSLALFTGVGRATAQSDPCGCPDKADLLNRYREAAAAVAEYKSQITALGNQGYSYALYRNQIQPAVQIAMNKATSSGVNKLIGATHPGTCELQVTPKSGSPTACLRRSVEAHEQTHVAACKNWQQLSTIRGNDYRNSMTMAAVLQEEIQAYSVEMKFIKDQLAATCPLGWTLSFEVTISGEGSETRTPSSGEINQVRWKLDRKYSGTIDLSNGTPVLSTSALENMENMTLQQQMQAARAMAKAFNTKSVMLWTTPSKSIPLDVTINDQIIVFTRELGEGRSWEETTTTQTWTGRGQAMASEGPRPSFQIDSTNRTYEVAIRIRPTDDTKQLTVSEKKDISRSAAGKGTVLRESKVTKQAKEPFKSIVFPVVRGTLEAGLQYVNKPLHVVNDAVEFTDDLRPTEPFLVGLPRVRDNVKIHVHYRLTAIEPE